MISARALVVQVGLLCAFLEGCGGDGTAAPALEMPRPAEDAGAAHCSDEAPVGEALANLAWQGLGERGEPRTIALRDYREPCDARPRVLVVRVNGGTWCGTCRWHAGHTGELMKLDVAPRLRWLDLVIGDTDNAPAGVSNLPAWRALVDTPAGIATAADPSFALRALGPESGVILPLYVFIDTRTMTVRGTLSNPNPAELTTQLERRVAELDGALPPPPRHEEPTDGVFHRNEWDMIRDVGASLAPGPDPTNAVADSAAAAALGKALFFDTGLSSSNTISCATCHDPQKQLSDDRPVAVGLAKGSRKTPRIALAALSRWQFWDGRADSLWAQALGPLENPDEMGSTRLEVVRRLATSHSAALSAAFPRLLVPDLAQTPGDDTAITRVFVAAGKAIAAYERTFRVQPNALDAYVTGNTEALSPEEKQGLAIFAKVGCMQCHWGPRLTDDAFHVTRLATGRADGLADLGRSDGLAKLRASEFLGTGRWSDAPQAGRVIPASTPRATVGAFKTPSLRGVARSAPFGHGGTEADLVTITESYGLGALAAGDPRAAGDLEPWLMRFSVVSQWAIPPFLQVLTAEPLVP